MQRGTYVIEHVGRSMQVDACVVRPLQLVDAGAILRVGCSVEDVVTGINQSSCKLPVPHLLRPLRVGVVSRIPCQPRAEVEQASVCNAVLVRKPVIEGEDLPPKAAPARRRVPPRCQLIEDGLR